MNGLQWITMKRHNHLGHTFTNSLDAASEQLFWAIVAQKGLMLLVLIVLTHLRKRRQPQHPLYMHIGEAYCDWWEKPSTPGPHTSTPHRSQSAKCNTGTPRIPTFMGETHLLYT
jgi:hypothetical protein